MAATRKLRLADALILILMALVPLMLLLAVSENRPFKPGILFWLGALLPLILLPWLWLCCDPEESEDAPRAAAQRTGTDAALERFAEAVEPLVPARQSDVQHGVPTLEGVPRMPAAELYPLLERRLAAVRMTPLVEPAGDDAVRVTGLPFAVTARLQSHSSPLIHILLFVATLLTTIYAGALHQGINLLEQPFEFAAGLPYALALLGVLGVHEFGHYAAARRHGVEVTLPYFIPVPIGLGTFGAFIQMTSLIRTRRAIFDIGIAGPLAGLAVALPLLYFGIERPTPLNDTAQTGIQTSSSLLLAIIYRFAQGGELGEYAVNLSPAAFAGWIGLFVTALNLLPVGQLDGGHIAYALFGRRGARALGLATTVLMGVLGLFVWPGLLTWAIIIALLAGFSHMPALDDVTAPDLARFALGAAVFVLLLLILMPVPGGGPTLSLDVR